MVRRWDIVTIGNLSRNRYWGEGEESARRPALCTCTLIRTDDFLVLVDPSLSDPQQMASELDRRTGLKPADIHTIFITHPHGDHHAGLRHFPAAQWLAAPDVAAEINRTAGYPKPVEPAVGRIGNDIEVFPTPGHTPHHHSLRFSCDGLRVVVTGDAVMTRDFWLERRGYFNTTDPAALAATMAAIAAWADLIVPGHDNYFLHRAAARS